MLGWAPSGRGGVVRAAVAVAGAYAAGACTINFGQYQVAGGGGATGVSNGATGSGSGSTSSAASTSAATSTSASTSAATSTSASTSASTSVASSSTGMMMPCGNGMLDTGEGCDDANTDANDGCSATCKLEGAADKCPTGEVIQLKTSIVISDTTTGKGNPGGGSCGGGSAPDMVFQIMPTKTAPVKITLDAPNFDRILVVRPTCTQSGGSDPVCIDGNATLMTTVQNATQGQAFHVMVTGHSGGNGPFTLTISY